MYIANELKNIVDVEHNDIIRESMMQNIFEVLYKYIQDKTMFTMNDFTLYYLDEYSLGTNCNKDIFSTIYLEIDQPHNYKINPSTKPKKKKNSGSYVIPDLYLKLSDIRKGITDTCQKHFDSNNIIWQDKFSTCIKSTVMFEDNTTINYYFRIIPGFTYYNKDNVKGIVYYANNDIQIEYPSKFIENFVKKNKKTKDLFRQVVLIFKNILLKEKNIDRLPSEIIETLVYNVPNELIKGDDKQSIINIVNFIRNNPLRSFRTIDDQDFAFSSMYRSMSIIYSRHILKIIEKFLTRT